MIFRLLLFPALLFLTLTASGQAQQTTQLEEKIIRQKLSEMTGQAPESFRIQHVPAQSQSSYELSVVILSIVAFAIFGMIIWKYTHHLDEQRIRRYLEQNRQHFIEKKWKPFGTGWFGEKDSRIYLVVYRDSSGNLYDAHVKTSLFSGVYFTNQRLLHSASPPNHTSKGPEVRSIDRLLHPASPPSHISQAPTTEEKLRRENEELRRKLRELENR